MSMEDEKIRLKVLGISYSHIQSGAYALILSQVGGPYKIPVVIGAAEAQSIAIRMEKIIT
ncbi:bifunctional nuclease family protein, partial [Muribaculum caecicola]